MFTEALTAAKQLVTKRRMPFPGRNYSFSDEYGGKIRLIDMFGDHGAPTPKRCGAHGINWMMAIGHPY